ncbi:MAG TPA: hypothetical protein VF377_08940 [Acidimicrobiia bacterium]
MATEIEKTPTADTSVNKPESGTYGERAEVEDLKSQLPPMASQLPGAGTQPSPMPAPNTALPSPGGRPMNLPAGLPDVILAGQPEAVPQPVSPQPSVDPQSARLLLLQALATSPEVSDATREWAGLILEALSAD